MTDLAKLTSLFDEFGIGYETKEYFEPALIPKVLRLTDIKCEKGKDKISGYWGFFTDFTFNPDGQFVGMGAWE